MRSRGAFVIVLLVLGLSACGSKQHATSGTNAASVPTTSTATTASTPTVSQATIKAAKKAAAKVKKKAKAKAASSGKADKAKQHKAKKHHHSSPSSGGGSAATGSSDSTPAASATPSTSSSSTPAASSPATPEHHATHHKKAPAKKRARKPSPPSGPLEATLHAPNHKPKVGHWPISVTLTKGGQGVAGHISYEFRFNGQVVSRQKVAQPPIPPGGAHSPNFVGRFHDVLTWPDRAVGIPLTLRVIVTSKYGTKNLDWDVVVQKA